MNISFDVSDVTIREIKERFHLNDICPSDTAQKENIALSIKLLFFYCDMLHADYPKDLEALLCREVIILSYSIIDGLVACLGFLMQERCITCKSRCAHYSIKMFSEDSVKKNERRAFEHADKYLRSCSIINLTSEARAFYSQYRDRRNNVHLSKNCEIITQDSCFNREHCDRAVRFFTEFIDMLYENHNEFIMKNRCCDNKRRFL